jgi:hypothetical protein
MTKTPIAKQVRHNRYLHSGNFKSNFVKWASLQQAKRLLYVCSKVIWENYYQDDLKAPFNNQPKMASVSKASMNFYFGRNLEQNEGLICRTAYAVGSGASSIGLNPLSMKVHVIFPEMAQLMALARDVVMNNTEFAATLRGMQFNFCSVKMYFSYSDKKGKMVRKHTNWHVDVTHNRKTKVPMANNSQLPGTPVVITTFGDCKDLEFRKYLEDGDHDDRTRLLFQQRNGSIFLMHPQDEAISTVDGSHWRHKSEMKKDNENVTISYMFRVVQRKVWVNAVDSTLANPTFDKRRQQQFEKAAGKTHCNYYIQANQDLQTRMGSVLERFSVK